MFNLPEKSCSFQFCLLSHNLKRQSIIVTMTMFGAAAGSQRLDDCDDDDGDDDDNADGDDDNGNDDDNVC